jgi:hypothetical protein
MKTPPTDICTDTDICSNYWKSQVQIQNRLAKHAVGRQQHNNLNNGIYLAEDVID